MKKRMKQIMAVVLGMSMAAGLCACGGSGGSGKKEEGAKADSDKYEKVVFAYQTFNNVPSEEGLAEVQEAVNKITREKIGVEVELKPIAYADYNNQISLSLQAGEQIDLFESLFNFPDCVAADMAMDITELAPEFAPEALELVGEEWMKACTLDGKLYGIPVYKPLALTPMITYRKDITDELGIDMSQVNDVNDLDAVYAKVKEAHPEMTPLAPIQPGDTGLSRVYDANIDYLGDDSVAPKAVLMGDDTTVVSLFETQEFMDICKLARDWYNKGYIMKDAATTTSMSLELMSSGNYFSTIASYSYPEEDTAASLQTQWGYPTGVKILKEAYIDTSTVNMVTFMVSTNCEVPEAALKFLDLTYSDKEIVNLLIFGIEGRDYVMKEDGTVNYPEGEDAATVPYTAQLSSGTLGNFFIQYQMEGTNMESLKWEEEQNRKAATSPVMGFVFDTSPVSTEYTALANVLSQYLPGLLCGNVDPETEIPKLNKAMESAGLGNVIAEKQKQLDAWLAAQ